MLETKDVKLEDVYVPAKRRKTLEVDKVESLALSIIELGQQTPIQVRPDKDRFVLVSGLHRLEALRALGEETVRALIVGTHRR
ncbi:MAG: ParB N-terminal domain-containing protein [Alphaproteobacteria bacterium]|jgi:ParB-like chromosome segregation protein Spo0J|nr:ParB N-terminal domain-containing protein [Alphaproteobacteria bacterium]